MSSPNLSAKERFDRLLEAMALGKEKPEPKPDKGQTKKPKKEKPAD